MLDIGRLWGRHTGMPDSKKEGLHAETQSDRYLSLNCWHVLIVCKQAGLSSLLDVNYFRSPEEARATEHPLSPQKTDFRSEREKMKPGFVKAEKPF
jgi:hypothetical protein